MPRCCSLFRQAAAERSQAHRHFQFRHGRVDRDARAVEARLPGNRFVYLGDTARLPYGTKSADTVTRYAVAGERPR